MVISSYAQIPGRGGAGSSACVALCNLRGLCGASGEIFEKGLMVLLSSLKRSVLWWESVQDWCRLIGDVD